jgi:hypothetical protein
LIINIKNPRDTRVMGSVRKIRRGLKTEFKSPRITAAKKADKTLSTIIPLKNTAVTRIARVWIRTLNQKYLLFIFYLF